MELESLKPLEAIRDVYTYDGYFKITQSEMDSIIQDVKSEIAEKFIRLPTCSDGVIKIGDDIGNDYCRIGNIDAIQFNEDGSYEVFHNGNSWEVSGSERHVDWLDDLLFTYGQECIRASNEAKSDNAKRTMLTNLRKSCALDIRDHILKEG